jgi:hypothetical protein
VWLLFGWLSQKFDKIVWLRLLNCGISLTCPRAPAATHRRSRVPGGPAATLVRPYTPTAQRLLAGARASRRLGGLMPSHASPSQPCSPVVSAPASFTSSVVANQFCDEGGAKARHTFEAKGCGDSFRRLWRAFPW